MTTPNDYRKLDAYIAIAHRPTHQRNANPNGHGERVSALSARLAKFIGRGRDFIKEVRYAGRIHDFGKVVIGIEILEKLGSLTPDEWLIIKSHPLKVYEVLEDLKLSSNAIPLMVLNHHVYYSGGGYPATHIKEQDIPEGARILTIVDVWDALTNDRIYRMRKRRAMTPKRALSQMAEDAAMFDPVLLAAFIKMMKVTK